LGGGKASGKNTRRGRGVCVREAVKKTIWVKRQDHILHKRPGEHRGGDPTKKIKKKKKKGTFLKKKVKSRSFGWGGTVIA